MEQLEKQIGNSYVNVLFVNVSALLECQRKSSDIVKNTFCIYLCNTNE